MLFCLYGESFQNIYFTAKKDNRLEYLLYPFPRLADHHPPFPFDPTQLPRRILCRSSHALWTACGARAKPFKTLGKQCFLACAAICQNKANPVQDENRLKTLTKQALFASTATAPADLQRKSYDFKFSDWHRAGSSSGHLFKRSR